jgi:putative ABC transport system substrate-binding protein
MVISVDPVAAGIVDSLAHPGGNITGLAKLTRDLSAKRLELFKEVIPGISRIAILRNADSPAAVIASREYEAAGHALNVSLQFLEVRGPSPDFQSAFHTAVKVQASGLVTIRDPLLSPRSQTDRRTCHQEPTAFHERGTRLRRGRRPPFLCD